MPLVETLKRTVEHWTGRDRPVARETRRPVRACKPHRFWFADDGRVPNNPDKPLVIYRGAVRVAAVSDCAAVLEELFAVNGWTDAWRDGIHDYPHFHSRTHEVLGIARGRARVRFGGAGGKELDLKAGDVAVLPAGTGHQRLTASRDFLVVGAYPADGEYDECRATAHNRTRALGTIARVPVPEHDPVYGRHGPLPDLWR